MFAPAAILAEVTAPGAIVVVRVEELVGEVTSPARVREMLIGLVLVTSCSRAGSLADPGAGRFII
jgi:hypothetical protein